jgi:hypothetical protein
MRKCFRQGDVLLVECGDVPADAKPLKRQRGKLILARGEVTGHHHAVLERDAELVESESAKAVFLKIMGSGPALLTHQEHAPIEVPPGTYRVVQQREYTPTAPVGVAD